jgi:hypothetical protein
MQYQPGKRRQGSEEIDAIIMIPEETAIMTNNTTHYIRQSLFSAQFGKSIFQFASENISEWLLICANSKDYFH